MNLTKLFNKNYFIQNILKSKAVIALIVGIVPILNAIFLMTISSGSQTPVVADLRDISILNIMGMYVIPVILSLCLFGYVFKKKSVDFINSMPLTRKTIFVTNSIGGILLIIIMMLINVLLLGIESLIFTNLIIPFQMIIDYFVLWTVSYIFVFTVANIATSLAGNHVTMLVLTAIILFFIPFMHNYITGFNGQMYTTPYYAAQFKDIDGTDKEIFVDTYVKKIQEDTNYTWPYNYISCIFKGNVSGYSTESIVKMIILSIAYFFIGIYLFEKRKMEVNETSFKNTHMHMLVKSLTLIPIGIFYMVLINDISSFTVSLFIFGLIIAYCLIYDLITAKSIKDIKLGTIYFVITAILTVGIYYGVDKINNNRSQITGINVSDIQSVAFHIDEVDYTNKYSDYKMNGVYLNNERLLEIVRKNMQDSKYKECSMKVNLKLNNNEEYETDLYLQTEDYNEIVNIVLNNNVYMKEYINIDYSKVHSLTVDKFVVTGNELDEALQKLEIILANVELMDAYKLPNIYTTIALELYEDHENKTYSIPLNINKELLEGYIKESNENAKELTNLEFDIYSVRLFNFERTMAGYYEEFIEDKCKSDLATHVITSVNESVDVTKPLLRIRISAGYRGKYKNAEYFTNNVLEYIQAANNKLGGDLDE